MHRTRTTFSSHHTTSLHLQDGEIDFDEFKVGLGPFILGQTRGGGGGSSSGGSVSSSSSVSPTSGLLLLLYSFSCVSC